MARARTRVCSKPGCAHMQAEAQCPEHRAERDRYQRATTPTKVTRDHAERQRRAQAVNEHRAMQGDWCPGYLRAPHSSSDLTADHIVDIQHGGSPTGPLQVLCRSCNSRKAGQRWP
ncbi:HNH endonuclease [Rhodococcus qingshengii]|uniref:HNH endonuclease n=1 Tax=Rhodococcus qingshengii TaxID=334542 RepID=UPI0024B891A5|nr:HNH endonuclease [Rhodococcus qingshengii]MDJ0489146.1 HNH endonuclease [Rhodococcus qingshengii]